MIKYKRGQVILNQYSNEFCIITATRENCGFPLYYVKSIDWKQKKDYFQECCMEFTLEQKYKILTQKTQHAVKILYTKQ